jgi:hypothetical protein
VTLFYIFIGLGAFTGGMALWFSIALLAFPKLRDYHYPFWLVSMIATAVFLILAGFIDMVTP